ncbi:MAG: hypothetical protein ACD_57C00185G0001, partial [uncultured bacterium]
MLNRLLFALTFLAIVFFSWFFFAIQPVTRISSPNSSFEIKSATPLNTIISNLSKQQLIRSRTAFKLTVLQLGIANKIQAGFFELNSNMSASEIALALTKATAKQIRVTIPEGLRVEEINNIISKSFASVPDSNFRSADFAGLTKNLEGKLFPDTYDFELNSSTEKVLNRLTTRFNDVVTGLKIDPAKQEHILILASLLEREAANGEEMPQIAGVIEKRLAEGWPLQIDATVQYALGTKTCKKLDCNWWKQSLTLEDLKLVSPYNTYANKGMPPRPISNPGRSALEAAAKPVA